MAGIVGAMKYRKEIMEIILAIGEIILFLHSMAITDKLSELSEKIKNE